MNDLELSGRVLPALPPLPDSPDDLLYRLTDAWIDRYKSRHTKAAYKRDLTSWLTWCAECGVHPLKARMMNVDQWIAWQQQNRAARRSIARRVSVAASWYKYLIRNTAEDDEPLITHNPATTDARPNVDKDASPTVGLSRAEADRLITAADADGYRSSAIIRLMLTNASRCDVICTAKVTDLSWDRGHRVLTMPVKGDRLKRDPVPPPTARAMPCLDTTGTTDTSSDGTFRQRPDTRIRAGHPRVAITDRQASESGTSASLPHAPRRTRCQCRRSPSATA